MSCDCGCCPKCGCSATCTCNRNIWTLECRSEPSYTDVKFMAGEDFSYTDVETVADAFEGQYNCNGDNEYSSPAHFLVAGGYGERYGKKGTSQQWH